MYWHLIATVDLWSNHALCGTIGYGRGTRGDQEVEVQEVIDCVSLFYEEGQGGGGGGNYRKKNKFRCRVNMQEKRLVKFREAIW